MNGDALLFRGARRRDCREGVAAHQRGPQEDLRERPRVRRARCGGPDVAAVGRVASGRATVSETVDPALVGTGKRLHTVLRRAGAETIRRAAVARCAAHSPTSHTLFVVEHPGPTRARCGELEPDLLPGDS